MRAGAGYDWYTATLWEGEKGLRWVGERILVSRMIRGGFLTSGERKELTALARNGSAEHRVARRANALALLDKGWSCDDVGQALLLDDDTIRTWHRLYQQEGLEGIEHSACEGRISPLAPEQEARLIGWITATLPRTTRVMKAGLV